MNKIDLKEHYDNNKEISFTDYTQYSICGNYRITFPKDVIKYGVIKWISSDDADVDEDEIVENDDYFFDGEKRIL